MRSGTSIGKTGFDIASCSYSLILIDAVKQSGRIFRFSQQRAEDPNLGFLEYDKNFSFHITTFETADRGQGDKKEPSMNKREKRVESGKLYGTPSIKYERR